MSRHISLSLLRSCTILHKWVQTTLDLKNEKLACYSYWCWRCPSPLTRAESEHASPPPNLCHITWLTYTLPPSLIHTHTYTCHRIHYPLMMSSGAEETNIQDEIKECVQITVGQRGRDVYENNTKWQKKKKKEERKQNDATLRGANRLQPPQVKQEAQRLESDAGWSHQN